MMNKMDTEKSSNQENKSIGTGMKILFGFIFSGGVVAWITFFLTIIIPLTKGIELEFSDYWIITHKVEPIEGTKDCAIFDTITLPLTFYNTVSRHRAIGILKLEIRRYHNAKTVDKKIIYVYKAAREYEKFDPEEIETWNVKNFYVDSILAGNTDTTIIVEFYPSEWWGNPQFSWQHLQEHQRKPSFILQPNQKYQITLLMKTSSFEWEKLGILTIETGDVNELEISADECRSQADAIVY